MLELRRHALEACLKQLSDRERDLLLRRYQEHGSVQRESKQSRITPHRLYYAIRKLRERLLDCIAERMRQEGWQSA